MECACSEDAEGRNVEKHVKTRETLSGRDFARGAAGTRIVEPLPVLRAAMRRVSKNSEKKSFTSCTTFAHIKCRCPLRLKHGHKGVSPPPPSQL